MFTIDENMFRLAKMQETLLKVSDSNREENLEKYKKTVLEIDIKAFDDLLEEIKHIDEHNHSLENELQFLEKIKSAYDRLFELQLGFKRVCELYDSSDLELSDLSRINIEYIENRINAINGYLVNLKNIEVNKEKLQQLSEQLVVEEKKKELLSDRLQNLEDVLQYNFINAEGRSAVDERYQPISVISEYKKLDLDFETLLSDGATLDILLSKTEKERAEIEDTLKATQFCYNQTPNIDNRQILDETNKEVTKVQYRLAMLKIIKLVSQNFDSYEQCKEKRQKLIDLIGYRKSYLTNLGIRITIDPFDMTKVREQLKAMESMVDNSKIINGIRKEIAELTSRIEEMSNQNSNYLILLSDTRNLIENKISINDIDITSIVLPIEETSVPKEIAANQVAGVRDISIGLEHNMSIILQKTNGVAKRCAQMISGNTDKKEAQHNEMVPELVIVPKHIEPTKPEVVPEIFVPEIKAPPIFEDYLDELEDEEIVEDEVEEIAETMESNLQKVDIPDIFETVTPFEEPAMFTDRTDEPLFESPVEPTIIPFELPAIEEPRIDDYQVTVDDTTEEMPEAFWITQEDKKADFEEEHPLSFDDQINVLLHSEDSDRHDIKTRKKVA